LTQAQMARQLGIEAKRISHWKKQLQQHGTLERAFPGQGHDHDVELAQLRREVATLRMERDILKKQHSSSPSLQEDEVCFRAGASGAVASENNVPGLESFTGRLCGVATSPAPAELESAGRCSFTVADQSGASPRPPDLRQPAARVSIVLCAIKRCVWDANVLHA